MSRKGTQRFSPERRRRVKRALLREYGPICQICKQAIDLTLPAGNELAFSIGHKKAWATGGSNKIDNLQPEHVSCNQNDPKRPL